MRRGFLKGQLAYWKRQLGNQGAGLTFKDKGNGRHKHSFGTATQSMEIRSSIVTELTQLARRENCTSFMLLLAVLTLALHAHTGDKVIRIGTTVANRTQRGTEEIIGNCLNVVVLQTHISTHLTFLEFLHQAKGICLAAIAHQDIPFGQVARAIAKENRKSATGYPPLFQALMIYQKRVAGPVELPGLIIAPWDGSYRREDQNLLITTLGLIFDLRESSTQLTGSVTYKTDMFSKGDIRNLIKEFHRILVLALSCPMESIDRMLDKTAT
jgi:hypothetical protein